jgi:hypothetical protein
MGFTQTGKSHQPMIILRTSLGDEKGSKDAYKNFVHAANLGLKIHLHSIFDGSETAENYLFSTFV